MKKTKSKSYVLEILDGVQIAAHPCKFDDEGTRQLELARELAQSNGKGAVYTGAVNYFWADLVDGCLLVGEFDEDLLENE